MHKEVNSGSNGSRGIRFGLFNVGSDSEPSGVGIVEIPTISMSLDVLTYGLPSFERVYDLSSYLCTIGWRKDFVGLWL